VLPALIRKFHEAKINQDTAVTIWGTGTPKREFLYVNDMADAAVFLLEHYSDAEIVNVGTGEDVAIKALAQLVQQIVGFNGVLVFDVGKPDGTPRKLLDVSKLKRQGWQAKTDLETGIRQTYRWFLDNRQYHRAEK
jgi:GDP-L-fucose synthase